MEILDALKRIAKGIILGETSMELSEFYGTYRGFSPTDESPVMLGELEVSVSPDKISSRMATGLGVESYAFPTRSLENIKRKEIRSFYQDTPSGKNLAKRSTGFSYSGLQYLFLENPSDDEVGLLIQGGLGDLLGPTLLFSPSQVERGVYSRALDAIETDFGCECVPRLSLEGKIPEAYHASH